MIHPDRVPEVDDLKQLVAEHAVALSALTTAVGEDIDEAVLTKAERRVDELEIAILDYRPLAPPELLDKIKFVHMHIMNACDQSLQVGTMLTAVERDVRDMLGLPQAGIV